MVFARWIISAKEPLGGVFEDSEALRGPVEGPFLEDTGDVRPCILEKGSFCGRHFRFGLSVDIFLILDGV